MYQLWLQVCCWKAVLRRYIFTLFSVSEKFSLICIKCYQHSMWLTEQYLSSWESFLCSWLAEFSSWEGLDFVKNVSIPVDIVIWFFFLNLLMWLNYSIDFFFILNQPCLSRVNPICHGKTWVFLIWKVWDKIYFRIWIFLSCKMFA